jgi:hypothetical protein
VEIDEFPSLLFWYRIRRHSSHNQRIAMKKLFVLGLLLLSGIASAATRYDFSYTGLRSMLDFPWEDSFLPNEQYFGSFTVEDSNGDGTYQQNEVLEFYIGRRGTDLFDVLGAFENGSWGYLESFNYTPGGQLIFRGQHAYQSDR